MIWLIIYLIGVVVVTSALLWDDWRGNIKPTWKAAGCYGIIGLLWPLLVAGKIANEFE